MACRSPPTRCRADFALHRSSRSRPAQCQARLFGGSAAGSAATCPGPLGPPWPPLLQAGQRLEFYFEQADELARDGEGTLGFIIGRQQQPQVRCLLAQRRCRRGLSPCTTAALLLRPSLRLTPHALHQPPVPAAAAAPRAGAGGGGLHQRGVCGAEYRRAAPRRHTARGGARTLGRWARQALQLGGLQQAAVCRLWRPPDGALLRCAAPQEATWEDSGEELDDIFLGDAELWR